VTVVFEGPRALLSVPYELTTTGFAPLAIAAPVCRTIADPAPGLPFDRLARTLDAGGHRWPRSRQQAGSPTNVCPRFPGRRW